VVHGISGDMAPEGELPKNQKHLVAPASVVVGIHVKYWRDEGADFLDADSLGVQVYDGGGLMIQEGVLERLARATAAGKRPEVIELAGKGGDAVSRLDFALAATSSVGKHVTSMSGN